jgi:hypothetical protein
MKKMPLWIAAVMFIAIMSAFTTKKPTQLFYRESETVFKEIEGEGICDDGDYHCQYEWVGMGDPGSTNDPNDYSPLGPSDQIFIPAP